MTESVIRHTLFHDVAHFGVRITVGLIFIMHSLGKFEPGFLGFLERLGLPPEMQFPIALAEFVPGILLIIGGLTRISASILAIVMLGAIFVVKGAENFTGQGGTELDILLLASCLVIIVIGPCRISISYILKKVPRFLQ
ncbi:MAG: DoxX family protein [Nitrosopumilus sp.]|nr:DoxX family protein [Nitrosopumilus sp.]MDH3490166.1 DoxX family protein [Nitrosopumilus sp.]MDH3516905.1 DoxX family protein [Nitrosopumilus sp.]MDH3565280.1 DoxX family protein [Nitrosopumilus sp.]MDH5554790.1 DoxX family protein [Nitrosopumilus sp.]